MGNVSSIVQVSSTANLVRSELDAANVWSASRKEGPCLSNRQD